MKKTHSMNLSKMAMNTEFFVISNKNNLIFPKTFDDSFLNNDILNYAQEQLSNIPGGEIVDFRYEKNTCLATYKKIGTKQRNMNLIFISSTNSAQSFIRLVNLILFVIMFVVAGACLFIALRISESISKPITRLSEYAKNIGKGQLSPLSDDFSSEEIHELTRSMNDMSLLLKNQDMAQKTLLKQISCVLT